MAKKETAVKSGKPMSPVPQPKENPMARSGGTLVPLGRKKS